MAGARSEGTVEKEAGSGNIEKMLKVDRVTHVVKGGRVLGFRASVVVGDGRGRVGVGVARASEVPVAMAKATEQASRNLVTIHLNQSSIYYPVQCKYGAALVVIKPAAPGAGVIAGGAMRAVFEAVGITDVVAKSMGSNNPINVARATMKALRSISTPAQIAARRNKTVDQIQE